MIRSVTAVTVGLRAMPHPLLVPADAVALCQRNRRRWTPGPRSIWPRNNPLLRPRRADPINPGPLRLDLVAADEQGRIALDEVEQQTFVGDAAAIFAEGIGKADVERDLAQANPAAVEARSLGHQEQADRLFRLEADDQLVRPRCRPARGKNRIRHVLELDEDLGVALRHALAGPKVEGDTLPSPVVDVGLDRNEGLGCAVVASLLGVAGH